MYKSKEDLIDFLFLQIIRSTKENHINSQSQDEYFFESFGTLIQ